MADPFDDRDALAEQYADADNLNDRIALHERYSTANRDFRAWQFDQFDLPDGAGVLSLGCGPADLWAANADRVPDRWDVTVTDLSPGMVAEARANLPDGYGAAVADAAALPFDDGSVDAVTAHHMLYHVPERDAALREIRRVLRPGGRLYATTNGEANMLELHDAIADALGERPDRASSFTLENGAGQLREHFDAVEVRRFDDGLRVTEVEPLIAYALSRDDVDPSAADDLREAFERRFEDGAFHIGKDVGMFVATAP